MPHDEEFLARMDLKCHILNKTLLCENVDTHLDNIKDYLEKDKYTAEMIRSDRALALLLRAKLARLNKLIDEGKGSL